MDHYKIQLSIALYVSCQTKTTASPLILRIRLLRVGTIGHLFICSPFYEPWFPPRTNVSADIRVVAYLIAGVCFGLELEDGPLLEGGPLSRHAQTPSLVGGDVLAESVGEVADGVPHDPSGSLDEDLLDRLKRSGFHSDRHGL